MCGIEVKSIRECRESSCRRAREGLYCFAIHNGNAPARVSTELNMTSFALFALQKSRATYLWLLIS